MKLIKVQVTKFRNFLDSTPVQIQDDITCLVGKNESGKTAFLQALYFLNPARSNAKFSIPDHYPAWLEKVDRSNGEVLESVTAISADFELSDQEIESIEARFGPGSITSKIIQLQRDYSGKLNHQIVIDETVVVKKALTGIVFPVSAETHASEAETIIALRNLIQELNENGAKEAEESCKALEQALKEILAGAKDDDLEDAVWKIIEPYFPCFFYYNTYSVLPYSVDIKKILNSNESGLDDKQLTARALLKLAAAEDVYLLNTDYERRKRELENVANAITADVLKYWSQNQELRVQPDITQKTIQQSNGQSTVIDELKIRVWDDRHLLSLPFDQHSTGFQWFFSFLAAFSEYENKKTPVVILLDEPALGLHARAQADFLRFIEERLAKKWQVLYTTHSPFMIQPGHLERVRLVEDRGKEGGSKITCEVMTTDPDTLFPLQGALGYDLAQHLFIAPHNLIVEGTSDFTFLSLLSDFLAQTGKKSLDASWSIVPVGGADAIPTFIALLGQHLNVTVLIDSRKEGNQRIASLVNKGYLPKNRIIAIGEILGRQNADIEDLFTVEDYLTLYNLAYKTSVKPDELRGKDPIVAQLARHMKVERYDHGLPAEMLLRKHDELLSKLTPETLGHFEQLFYRINSTLNT